MYTDEIPQSMQEQNDCYVWRGAPSENFAGFPTSAQTADQTSRRKVIPSSSEHEHTPQIPSEQSRAMYNVAEHAHRSSGPKSTPQPPVPMQPKAPGLAPSPMPEQSQSTTIQSESSSMSGGRKNQGAKESKPKHGGACKCARGYSFGGSKGFDPYNKTRYRAASALERTARRRRFEIRSEKMEDRLPSERQDCDLANDASLHTAAASCQLRSLSKRECECGPVYMVEDMAKSADLEGRGFPESRKSSRTSRMSAPTPTPSSETARPFTVKEEEESPQKRQEQP